MNRVIAAACLSLALIPPATAQTAAATPQISARDELPRFDYELKGSAAALLDADDAAFLDGES